MISIEMNYKNADGQIVLITLLVTAVALTLGLSASKKVVTETRIDVDEENLRKAFDTAESGINYYLGVGETTYSSADGSVATVTAQNIDKEGTVLEFADSTLPGGRVNFWLVAHDGSGNIDYADGSNFPGGSSFDVCVGVGSSGSVLIEYFYGNGTPPTTFNVNRWGHNLAGGTVTGFTAEAGTSCGAGRVVVRTIEAAPGSTPLMVSVRPLTHTLRTAINTTASIPSQGQEISSTAVVGDQSTGVRRTLRVYNLHNIPSFMFDAINGGIVTSQ